MYFFTVIFDIQICICSLSDEVVFLVSAFECYKYQGRWFVRVWLSTIFERSPTFLVSRVDCVWVDCSYYVVVEALRFNDSVDVQSEVFIFLVWYSTYDCLGIHL